MKQYNAVKLFEQKKVRSLWDEEKETWYYSIVDVVAILTESENPQVYWRVLKKRLIAEGNETVTNCNAFKMPAPDGKMRLTDVADTEQLFRIIQSIPSPKAEPFKQWLAQVGKERLEEIDDPELAISRALPCGRRNRRFPSFLTGKIRRLLAKRKKTAILKTDLLNITANQSRKRHSGGNEK